MDRRNFKKVALLMFLTVCLIMGSTVGFAKKQYTVTLIVKNLVNPFWNYMKEGAEAAGKKLGVTIITLAPIKPDNVEEQIRAIEDSIKRKVDGIAIVPSDSNGIIPGIEEANAAGIPVICTNSKTYGGKVISFVGVDNFDCAYRMGKFATKALKNKGKVIILEGVQGAQTSTDRKNGFNKALSESPQIKVLTSQSAENQRAIGMSVMENLIQRFPDFDAVISSNDEMALGAIEALDAANLLKKVKVFGFDGNRDAVQSIYQGKLVATLYQDPQAQAAEAIKALVDYIEGRTVPAQIPIKGAIITKGSVTKFMDIYGLKH